MEVILQEKIRNLGDLGEKVEVKPGYARNFLLPQGKAVFATAENLAKFEAHRAELEKAAADELGKAKQRAEAIEKLETITITAKVTEEGKLFGSVGVHDIAEAIVAAGVPVENKEIDLPHGAIHEIGEYECGVLLHSDVAVTVALHIVAEE